MASGLDRRALVVVVVVVVIGGGGGRRRCCRRFYVGLFRPAIEQTHCALVACYSDREYLQRYVVVIWLVPRATAAVSAHVLCTPYNHAPVYSVTSY